MESEFLETIKEEQDDPFEHLSSTDMNIEDEDGDTKDIYNSENMERDVDNEEALEEPLSLPTKSEPDLESAKEETNLEETCKVAENTEDISCNEDAMKRENDDEEVLSEPAFVPVNVDFEGKLQEIKEEISEESESTEGSINGISRQPHMEEDFQNSSSAESLPGVAVEMDTKEQASNCFSSELLRQMSASFCTASRDLSERQEEEQWQHSNQREIERGTLPEGEMQTSASLHSSSEKSERKCRRRTFVCSTCKSKFSSKYFLDKHVRVHTGENPHKCSQCEKSFSSKENLSLHMHLHTGEKPYSCSQCEKSFHRHTSLTRHMLLHTGRKPYSCSQCEKTFYQHSSLTRHMSLHRGEKPYNCSQCNKSFSQKGNLTAHIRLHTGERPYKCSQCDKSFRDKYNLTVHVATHE